VELAMSLPAIVIGSEASQLRISRNASAAAYDGSNRGRIGSHPCSRRPDIGGGISIHLPA